MYNYRIEYMYSDEAVIGYQDIEGADSFLDALKRATIPDNCVWVGMHQLGV